jgi:hypothetical protein
VVVVKSKGRNESRARAQHVSLPAVSISPTKKPCAHPRYSSGLVLAAGSKHEYARHCNPTNPTIQPLTLSDIVLVKRHKSAGARIRQPRPRASSTTLAPFQRQESHSRPGTAPPRDAYGSRPDNPRPRPVTAPYPRLPSDTVSTSTTHPRSPNPALVHLLATKPPPPPPPHQHQRSASLHPQPPPLRLRTSFSSAHPAPNSDADMHSSTNPQSRISRHPRPTSAYGPSTMTAKPNLATNTRPFPSVPPPIQKSKSQPPQFSTADRTILEELKRNISAKAAQFVIKGSTQGGITGGTVIGMGKRGGGRHHPFRKEDVPYPRCYEREAIDLWVEFRHSGRIHVKLDTGTYGRLRFVSNSARV